jgi:hypothetical protein
MADTREEHAMTSEERAIRAAREYIAKHRSMNPSQAVLSDLNETEERLEQRQREIDQRRRRRPALAG